MKNISDKLVEKPETHFIFSKFFPFENRAVYKIMWKNTVDRDRSHVPIRGMRIACWILKATNTHTVCVIFITVPLSTVVEKTRHNVNLYVH